jgi:hypothetical protein
MGLLLLKGVGRPIEEGNFLSQRKNLKSFIKKDLKF